MRHNTLKRAASISTVFFALSLISLWLMLYGGHHRTIYQKSYNFTVDDARKLKHHPRFLFLYGLNAWFRNDSITAARFFRQALLEDVLHVDAWIRLSQTELVLGNADKARSILVFMEPLTKNIYRWKWRQTLLAYDLGIKETVIYNINFLVSRQKMIQDAFQLLDTHVSQNISETIEVLDRDNLIPLLQWLIRWNRADDAEIVWRKITESVVVGEDILLQYIHFLIDKKRVQKASDLWRGHTGIEGLTNAGFEKEITGKGFDWRYTPDSQDKWSIRRTTSSALDGTYSLKIVFEGKENISFAHLYQIAAVDPLQTYRLTYRWRSHDIGTDQGPFINIYGYDCTGINFRGPMILGTNDWQEQNIEFTAPINCHAVVIRLRRQTSHRFDNKISGTLWLDNFELKALKPTIKPEISRLSPLWKKIDKRVQI